MLWSTQVELYVRLASIRLRWAYTFCDPTYMTTQLDLAQANLDFTNVLVDQLLYGSKDRNLPPGLQEGNAEYNNLWLTNACSPSEGWFYQAEECRTFLSGLVARGLQGAVASYSDVGRKLIEARRSWVGRAGCVTENIETPGTMKAETSALADKYLASGFERSTAMQYAAALTYLQAFGVQYTATVAITIAFLLVLWLVVYSPQIQRLDKDIKNVRLLLLLFPDEVARSVPAIVAAGKRLLAEAGGGGSGGSAAGSVARH